MELTINGAGQQHPDGITVSELVLDHARSLDGVAVAVDGEIVHRADWPGRVLRPNQAVELITAIQGG